MLTGLQKRPTFEELVVYKNPLVVIPERNAWFVRNSIENGELDHWWVDRPTGLLGGVVAENDAHNAVQDRLLEQQRRGVSPQFTQPGQGVPAQGKVLLLHKLLMLAHQPVHHPFGDGRNDGHRLFLIQALDPSQCAPSNQTHTRKLGLDPVQKLLNVNRFRHRQTPGTQCLYISHDIYIV